MEYQEDTIAAKHHTGTVHAAFPGGVSSHCGVKFRRYAESVKVKKVVPGIHKVCEKCFPNGQVPENLLAR